MGCWLWIEGYGIAHVEDVFPENVAREGCDTVFDLASPEAFPGQTYTEWLDDSSRVKYARHTSRHALGVVLKEAGDNG